MKRSIIISIASLIIVLGTIGLVQAAKIKANSGYSAESKSKSTDIKTKTNYLVEATPKTCQDLSTLSSLGYQIDVPDQPAVISKDEAVKNAVEVYPGLKGNNNYTVEYQILTCPGFNAFSAEALQRNPVLKAKKAIDHLPVYIISYKNMLIPVHSGIFTKPIIRDNSLPKGYQTGEYNIVVDSTSGVPLLAFSYR